MDWYVVVCLLFEDHHHREDVGIMEGGFFRWTKVIAAGEENALMIVRRIHEEAGLMITSMTVMDRGKNAYVPDDIPWDQAHRTPRGAVVVPARLLQRRGVT